MGNACCRYILVYPQGCDVANHLSLFLCVADYDKLLPGWAHFAQFTIAVSGGGGRGRGDASMVLPLPRLHATAGPDGGRVVVVVLGSCPSHRRPFTPEHRLCSRPL